ncbi:hypothetical protein BK666_29640 [Pseudomonas frederiksbergensis]|uniref:Uncharacterized protein n=1 Tax=Pseudomonas frederiksbergensis TaxID=104087 RepID=A0A423JKH7_9PSED|nr:hypothetical protein BK666_29640 [Pseudomonas frederiksbergensis]
MRDVGDVFDVAVFEAGAVQGFEEVAGGSDSLEGGFEDVLGVTSVSMIRGGESVRLVWSGR